MRVVVLGGAGLMAYATINDLVEIDGDETSEIVIADKNFEKVRNRAKEFGSEKITPASIDISDHASLVKLIKGYDVAINMAVEFTNIPAMKACLEAGVNYIDLGATSFERVQAQLNLDDEFKRAGLTAIVGLGSTPGIDGIMARYLVDKLDTVESIYTYYAYASFTTRTVPITLPWTIDTLLDCFTKDVIIFDEGKHVFVPPRSGREEVLFPDPIGKCTVMFESGSQEVLTYPIYFRDKGIKRVWVKTGLFPELMEQLNFLIDLGLASSKPIMIKDKKVVPRDILIACVSRIPQEKAEPVDYGCTRVEVIGEKSGEKVTFTADMINRPYRGLTGVQHRTGHAPSIGARMIHRGDIQQKGVFPPEVGINPKVFFRELTKRELEVYYTVTYVM